MIRYICTKLSLATIVLTILAAPTAFAKNFDIPGGDLEAALNAYTAETGVALIVSDTAVKGVHTKGAHGNLSEDQALSDLLKGTGFITRRDPSGPLAIIRGDTRTENSSVTLHEAAATTPSASSAALETVTVTSSKIGGDVQNIPISITALSQEQLTATQTAGGPDLIKQVPNMTFTKTNFSGYSIQLRGIGTQAISVTTDPAVAVALNDIPFIRNHFFEQEFYDLSQAEVLRGPQGTLYGRNATAGVVNLITARPSDQFEAMASADVGNYQNRRFEGMLNVPIVDDRLDLRIAGEWTKRDGYAFNETTNSPIDGRDLWSSRVTLRFKPNDRLQADLIWEHFQEDDDRLRSGKQLCETSNPPASVDGVPIPSGFLGLADAEFGVLNANYFSQGCKATSLYAPSAFEVPDGYSLPYNVAAGIVDLINPNIDPYAATTQSTNLRRIQSQLAPTYRAKNDTLEFNAVYSINPVLTFTSQTGYNQDFLWSTEDYNRFDTSPGIFQSVAGFTIPGIFYPGPDGDVFCDPQLGCSNRIVAEDLDVEHAWQFSQEFRLASNFGGPFNFSFGGNYLHYETEENYYVFINALSAYSYKVDSSYVTGTTLDANACLQQNRFYGGWQNANPKLGGGEPTYPCVYIDPNPVGSLDNKGHNYFLSQNPYTLNSYAGFGEAYYNIAPDLKFTAGLRYTIDRKHFVDIPSDIIGYGLGYAPTGVENQEWDRLTGRAVLNWSPKLNFTDQSMFYASYAHGYKAGGANPPGATFPEYAVANIASVVHPFTFKPEYIEAFELGTKNALLDGALTLNGDVFYYNYTGYQISRIVDRTAINDNFNAKVNGAELEASYEPLPGLKFNFTGGYEDTRINNGQSSIDLMDRTAGMPGWMVIKPFPTDASNCILPSYVIAALLEIQQSFGLGGNDAGFACETAYTLHLDPVTGQSYQVPTPTTGSAAFEGATGSWIIPAGYSGFNPAQAGINNGEGFAKPLGGNELPNALHFTTSFGAEYTIPVSEDWTATLHSDFYWQSQSWARVFNDRPYDELRGYSNVNLALIFTSANGWQVMGYLKNVFNTTAITGDFLNSDDSGLTTNVFLTDPRLYGVRVTKNF